MAGIRKRSQNRRRARVRSRGTSGLANTDPRRCVPTTGVESSLIIAVPGAMQSASIARMSSLTDTQTEFMRDAFQAEGLPMEHAGVTSSNRPDLGQFRSNCALAVAKALQRNPREIAERIRTVLLARHGGEFRDVSLAGPGFVNISLTEPEQRSLLS